jgi:hypothetical protein
MLSSPIPRRKDIRLDLQENSARALLLPQRPRKLCCSRQPKKRPLRPRPQRVTVTATVITQVEVSICKGKDCICRVKSASGWLHRLVRPADPPVLFAFRWRIGITSQIMNITKSISIVCATLLCLFGLSVRTLRADQQLTGTYSIGNGSDGNMAIATTATGPFTLTATVTPNTFSYVDFIPTNQTFTFADLTNLNAVFTSLTGAGGGSPRLSVELSNGITDTNLHIFFGTSPNYTDSATTLNTYSGVNLIGNNDAGRYDTSNFTGGSPFTTYSSALSLLGNYQVKTVSFVLDTFGSFGDRAVTLNSINASVASVPEPSILASLAAGSVILLASVRLKANRR